MAARRLMTGMEPSDNTDPTSMRLRNKGFPAILSYANLEYAYAEGLNREELRLAMQGMDVVYYLIHSMRMDQSKVQQTDKTVMTQDPTNESRPLLKISRDQIALVTAMNVAPKPCTAGERDARNHGDK